MNTPRRWPATNGSRLKLVVMQGLIVLLPFVSAAAMSLDRGLALYLPFTTDLKDHSSAQIPVKVVGNVTASAEGAVFGGENDWLEAPHVALDQRSFAISFWMKDVTSEQSVGLVEQLDENTRLRHFHIVLRKQRQPFFGFYPARFISPLSVPTNQEWVHLVFQYTGIHQQMWMNGRLLCTRESAPYEGTKGATTIGKLPRWTNVPGRNFKGLLRDFRIYDRTLDPAEIGILATANNSPASAAPNQAGTGNSPDLSAPALASRTTMERILSADPSLPLLEIGERQLVINGQPGQIYILQGTIDLSTWQPLAQLTNQNGRMVYPLTDRPAGGAQQFFRIKVESH